MNKLSGAKLKKLAVGALAVCLLAGSALAYSGQKSIDVVYNNIKLLIDGKEYTPKDANGNVVEPFTLNGTTFVPLRAVANAFGKEVAWDGATATVTIGRKDYTWFDTLNTYEFESISGRSYNKSASNIEKNGTKYERGMSLLQEPDSDFGYEETTRSTFLLNSEYKMFNTTLFAQNEHNVRPSVVTIYGDNKQLYQSPGITTETIPLEIELDVQGVTQLTVEISGTVATRSNDTYRIIIFANAQLTR